MLYDVIVIGGGPSGMIAAGTAGSLGKKVLLLEKNEKLGKKLYLTGKGRCNITNTASLDDFLEKIPRNSKFLYSSFNQFFSQDLIELLNNLGLKTKVERGNRVFPFSDKSSDVIKSLEHYLLLNNVTVKVNKRVSSIIFKDKIVKGVNLSNGDNIKAKSLIIATGGLSYPLTGSNGDGFKFAESLGHKITELMPSLIPLLVKEEEVKELQGLTLRNVKLFVKSNNEIIFEDFGEMVFTHFGLSGPLILSASDCVVREINNGKKIKIIIDLKPNLDYKDLNERLLNDFKLFSNKQFKNSLNNLLPKKMIEFIIKLSDIPERKTVNLITKEERKKLAFILKNISFQVVGPRPISEAIITSGGVTTDEINPKTMESKVLKGLYFAGEVIDVHGLTGGYNLQIAFSTGYTAGYNAWL